jgi:hypothetical protein
VRFAWDFEVIDINQLQSLRSDLVIVEPKRAAILATLKDMDERGYAVESLADTLGIRAFKKPIVSSR